MKSQEITESRNSNLEHLSRFMSLLLRHKPGLLGLWLDSDGFVDQSLDELAYRVSGERGFDWVTAEDIRQMVKSDPKGRYEIRRGRIRAVYGHSVPFVDPLEQPTPIEELPEVLYHGTTPEASEEILKDGLKPVERRHVHLSRLLLDAEEVARRRTEKPVMLAVDVHQAAQHGVKFRRATDDIFLADPIPSQFLYLVA